MGPAYTNTFLLALFMLVQTVNDKILRRLNVSSIDNWYIKKKLILFN